MRVAAYSETGKKNFVENNTHTIFKIKKSMCAYVCTTNFTNIFLPFQAHSKSLDFYFVPWQLSSEILYRWLRTVRVAYWFTQQYFVPNSRMYLLCVGILVLAHADTYNFNAFFLWQLLIAASFFFYSFHHRFLNLFYSFAYRRNLLRFFSCLKINQSDDWKQFRSGNDTNLLMNVYNSYSKINISLNQECWWVSLSLSLLLFILIRRWMKCFCIQCFFKTKREIIICIPRGQTRKHCILYLFR